MEVDGEYGPTTERQLEIVQATLGLDDDGMDGPKTRNRLKWGNTTGHCVTPP